MTHTHFSETEEELIRRFRSNWLGVDEAASLDPYIAARLRENISPSTLVGFLPAESLEDVEESNVAVADTSYFTSYLPAPQIRTINNLQIDSFTQFKEEYFPISIFGDRIECLGNDFKQLMFNYQTMKNELQKLREIILNSHDYKAAKQYLLEKDVVFKIQQKEGEILL